MKGGGAVAESASASGSGAQSGEFLGIPDSDLPFKEAKDQLLENWEREYIIALLRKNDNNISKAAKTAGIDRKSIQRILKKFNLTAKDL